MLSFPASSADMMGLGILVLCLIAIEEPGHLRYMVLPILARHLLVLVL